MTKRCIKGVLCVENITLILFIILGLLVFLFYKSGGHNSGSTSAQPQMQMQPQMQDHSPALMMSPKPNTFFTNDSADVLSNPYTPPLKDNMLLKGMGIGMSSGQAGAGPGIPINIATSSAVNTSYRQIGLLTKSGGNSGSNTSTSSSDPVILPLMGKPLFTSRDKWMFYTISDKNNSMKLPIIIKGRNALSEIGVDNVYTGDTVYVQGYNETFKVTLYENSTPQYIPFI
jgi:hypothetical protein